MKRRLMYVMNAENGFLRNNFLFLPTFMLYSRLMIRIM